MNAKFKTATSVFFVHVAKDASANVQKLFVILFLDIQCHDTQCFWFKGKDQNSTCASSVHVFN